MIECVYWNGDACSRCRVVDIATEKKGVGDGRDVCARASTCVRVRMYVRVRVRVRACVRV